ncbi:phosphoglucosamine mutase [Rubrimonas sp.]|uniref:phosphoglucosamine mutase n=1 Tax=Rubrimonas sp. TaxID=2036015 RepID=UPI002FDD8E79
MTRSLFGTDGVRGLANRHPMTAETALAVGRAAAARFRRDGPERGHAGRVVIGKDTRLSGYMIESALQAGFTSGGMDVLLLGPVPTPAVGMLTRSLRADVGVMVSASHNPFHDNGIKLFGPDGYKLSDAEEAEIEALVEAPPPTDPERIGRARRIEGGVERYVEVAKASFPRGLRLDGLKVVVDCAHGAAYRAAPAALWELGAEVIPLGVSPNGTNINDGCGSTHPQACAAAVLERGAHLGVALDGDADRAILIDERGRIVDGDQLMALIAGRWAAAGRLTGGSLVATVMSNLGLERWLAARGVGLLRTRVGDRYVVETMRAEGCNLGGEQSGHVILADFATTGDGLIAALQALAAVAEAGRPASETLRLFEPLPQKLISVRAERAALEHPAVRAAVAAVEARLNGRGRLLIRPSGTEPVIRVMAEGEDTALVETAVAEVADALGAA